MSIYYVSSLGNDGNDGLSPNSPWSSLAKVNASVKGGDEIRLRRGDTFYGRITPPANRSKITPTVYTSYGSGGKPVVSEYKIAIAEAWESAADNIWKLDLTDTSRFTGNVTQINTNVGFIKADGKIYPRKRFAPDALDKQWDFYNDGRYVYIKSEKRPSELAQEIKIACCTGCMGFADNIAVKGIIFNGTGAHGISGTVNGAVISDCEFHEIGGSQLEGYPTPNTRYGNGVECWSNSSDVTVERCEFSGIYDVAITMQGNEVRKCWSNMHFRDNVMWNNQQCFEIWSSGKLPDTGFTGCFFTGNVCIDSGYCWGYPVRPNKACSSHLLLYGLECPLCDITVADNLFSNARVATVYKSGGPDKIPSDYKIFDNTIMLAPGQDIAYRDGCSDDAYDKFYSMLRRDNRIIPSAHKSELYI